MVAVAERRVLRVLATAPSHGLGGGDFRFPWPEAAALVRTITKRLVLGFSTTAPKISARLNFLHDRGFLKNNRFAHLSVVAALLVLANFILSNTINSTGLIPNSLLNNL